MKLASMVAGVCYIVPRCINYFAGPKVEPEGDNVVDRMLNEIKLPILQRIKRNPVFHACYDNLWYTSLALFYLASKNAEPGEDILFSDKGSILLTGAITLSGAIHIIRHLGRKRFPALAPSNL